MNGLRYPASSAGASVRDLLADHPDVHPPAGQVAPVHPHRQPGPADPVQGGHQHVEIVDDLVAVGQERPDRPGPGSGAGAQAAQQELAPVALQPAVDVRVVQAGALLAQSAAGSRPGCRACPRCPGRRHRWGCRRRRSSSRRPRRAPGRSRRSPAGRRGRGSRPRGPRCRPCGPAGRAAAPPDRSGWHERRAPAPRQHQGSWGRPFAWAEMAGRAAGGLPADGRHAPPRKGAATGRPPGGQDVFPQGKDLCPSRGRAQREAGCGNRRGGAGWPGPGGQPPGGRISWNRAAAAASAHPARPAVALGGFGGTSGETHFPWLNQVSGTADR